MPAASIGVDFVANTARWNSDIDRARQTLDSNATRMNTALAGVEGRMNRFGKVSGSMRSGMQQLSFQIGDVATQFSSGTRPMQIFAQQAGQVVQAISLMSGGTSRFAAFMGGPWGAAITAATIILVPLISNLFETEGAADAAAEATKRLATAMDNLHNLDFDGGDLTAVSSKMVSLLGEAAALDRQAAQAGAGRGAGGRYYQQQADALREEAAQLRRELETATNPTNPARVIRDRNQAVLNAKPEKKERERRERRGREGPSAEEIARRFSDQFTNLTVQQLAAMGQVTTTTEARAELEMRALEWNSRQLKTQIAADEHFNATQKAELTAAAERLADYQREALDFRKRAELEQQAAQIADAQYQAANDNLSIQQSLADTEASRKSLALQIFDADTAYLRSKLEAVAASQTVSETERQMAQIQLEALNATAAGRRQAVGNANMTSLERFLADMNKSPGQFAEAQLGIGIDGINQLIDGLSRIPGEVDSIKSAFNAMRDVFQSVIQDMLADLIRLQLQKAISGLISSALGGVGGGPANLLAGIPGYASGTGNHPGGLAWVGEHGRELVAMPRGSQVIPNHRLSTPFFNARNDNGSGATFNVTVHGAMSERDARRTGAQIGSAASQRMAQARRAGIAG